MMDDCIDRLNSTAYDFDANFHRWNVTFCFNELQTSPSGLTSQEAKHLRLKYGENFIPKPISLPSWLCCLLSCVLNMKSMQLYQEIIPSHATVLRNRKESHNDCQMLKIDSASLVPGDIVVLKQNDIVPADLRLFEEENCSFDTSMLFQKASKKIVRADTADINDNDEVSYLQSENMAFLGYLVISGSAKGVVVATGKSTVLAQLIVSNKWVVS